MKTLADALNTKLGVVIASILLIFTSLTASLIATHMMALLLRMLLKHLKTTTLSWY